MPGLRRATITLGAACLVSSAGAIDLSQYPAPTRGHDASRAMEIAPGVYSVFSSSNPNWEHHLQQLVLDTNQPNPAWQRVGHWPAGQPIPGFESWTRGWWEEYGYDYENQVGHLEVAAVAPTQADANTVYFNMRNLPGWDFAIQNELEPAMFMGLYRATATGTWPNQTWAMDPLPVYLSDGFTHELGGPRAVDAQVWDDLDGKRYLTFGSWDPADGNVIVTAELDTATGRLAGVPTNEPGYYFGNESRFSTLARFGEAAAIYQRGPDDYHLFLNLGGCCGGVNSTYEIVTARSSSPLGPFVDRQGRRLDEVPPLADGQNPLATERFPGEPLLAAEGRYIGPGHAGVLENADGSLTLSFHFYDGLASGEPKLGFRQLGFDADGWATVLPTLDYNRDGLIDAADYTAWTTEYGDPAKRFADGNGDGVIDAADYTLWRDRVGTANPPTQPTPEPTAIALLLLGLSLHRLAGVGVGRSRPT